MPRTPNFQYTGDANLGASLGNSLGRALFGDPEAARKQREAIAKAALMAAQTGEANSHGRLYGEQADGQGLQNGSARSLPELIANLTRQPPVVAQPMPSDDLAPRPDAPAAPAGPNLADMLPVIAALAGMKGDKVDLGETISSLGAFAGPEEFARRGMVANGHTPGKDFALTPERADDILARDAAEGYNQATGVARINHANDIPIANIRATTARRGQDVGATTQRRGQDITSTTRRRGQDVADQVRREEIARKEAQQSVAPISPSTHQMLFGVANLSEKPGELKRQIDGRGWKQTPDAGTLIRIRAAVIDRYRQSGNPVQAVRDVLDEVKRRWDRKQSEPRSATQPPVQGARREPDGKWYVPTRQNPDGSIIYSRVDG